MPTSDPSYNCGYVLTKPNENVHASLAPYDTCASFYYNQSINGYQDAYAYKLFGGCACGFYSTRDKCMNEDGPFVEGPTKGEYWEVLNFAEPKPKWYNCISV
ncbi:Nn.00g019680.m01.CDS01 [Neocucurbitaria sp. VM-36]